MARRLSVLLAAPTTSRPPGAGALGDGAGHRCGQGPRGAGELDAVIDPNGGCLAVKRLLQTTLDAPSRATTSGPEPPGPCSWASQSPCGQLPKPPAITTSRKWSTPGPAAPGPDPLPETTTAGCIPSWRRSCNKLDPADGNSSSRRWPRARRSARCRPPTDLLEHVGPPDRVAHIM